MKHKEGFTLVELLIVLAVIAALLSTITPVALNAVRKAKATQVALNLRNIKTAVEQYVYTEQLATPSNLTLASLTSANYLSRTPENYDLEISNWSGGSAIATVVYTGEDVDVDMVVDSYQDAETIGSTGVRIVFNIAKYW